MRMPANPTEDEIDELRTCLAADPDDESDMDGDETPTEEVEIVPLTAAPD